MAQVDGSGPAGTVELSCTGRAVARYVWDPRLPAEASPRPYLHPVTTLAGTPVTAFRPADHVHHLGVSIAIPGLGGGNFWGGRTYVHGHGSVPLDNHGIQRHTGWRRRLADHLTEQLDWVGRGGNLLATEERSLTVRAVGADIWQLRFDFDLTNATGTRLEIDSPGARGRVGAGYGGFFWRAPADLERARAFAPLPVPGGVHGSRQPWVALTGCQPGADPFTLVFVADGGAGGGDPWFVRAEDYAGVCAALAWDRPLVLAPGGVLSRRMSVLVADGELSPAAVADAVAATVSSTVSSTASGTASGTPEVPA